MKKRAAAGAGAGVRKMVLLGIAAFGVLSSAQSAPVAGCYELDPPGTWKELQTATDRTFSITDDTNYVLSGAVLVEVQPDATGEWDWAQRYSGGILYLTNPPTASWHSPCTTEGEFTEGTAEIYMKLRSTRYESTNAGYVEFELVAQSDWITLRASYAGMPLYLQIPETPETVAMTRASAALDEAELCIGKTVRVDIRPGARVNPLNVKSRGVVPVAIYSASDLNVKTIDPASLRLQCVPPVRWSYENVSRDGRKDLLLKFDTQALAKNLPSDGNREMVTLLLTGALKNGTPISGTDQVIVLNQGKAGNTPAGQSRTPPGQSSRTPSGQTNNGGRGQ